MEERGLSLRSTRTYPRGGFRGFCSVPKDVDVIRHPTHVRKNPCTMLDVKCFSCFSPNERAFETAIAPPAQLRLTGLPFLSIPARRACDRRIHPYT